MAGGGPVLGFLVVRILVLKVYFGEFHLIPKPLNSKPLNPKP